LIVLSRKRDREGDAVRPFRRITLETRKGVGEIIERGPEIVHALPNQKTDLFMGERLTKWLQYDLEAAPLFPKITANFEGLISGPGIYLRSYLAKKLISPVELGIHMLDQSHDSLFGQASMRLPGCG
jgi:hypothetical protein